MNSWHFFDNQSSPVIKLLSTFYYTVSYYPLTGSPCFSWFVTSGFAAHKFSLGFTSLVLTVKFLLFAFFFWEIDIVKTIFHNLSVTENVILSFNTCNTYNFLCIFCAPLLHTLYLTSVRYKDPLYLPVYSQIIDKWPLISFILRFMRSIA